MTIRSPRQPDQEWKRVGRHRSRVAQPLDAGHAIHVMGARALSKATHHLGHGWSRGFSHLPQQGQGVMVADHATRSLLPANGRGKMPAQPLQGAPQETVVGIGQTPGHIRHGGAADLRHFAPRPALAWVDGILPGPAFAERHPHPLAHRASVVHGGLGPVLLPDQQHHRSRQRNESQADPFARGCRSSRRRWQHDGRPLARSTDPTRDRYGKLIMTAGASRHQ